ncbi:MAG: hypothetical protein Q7O66_14005 [Dehalococcoidia bacterium]|nr:hypothetical protein [Dehalococcoidia bacterium]
MKNEIKNILKGVAVGAVLMVGATVFAAWNEPSQNPTGGNPEPPINVSDTGQVKGGNLVVNNSNEYENGLIVRFGNLLVGTTNAPAGLKLNVGSGVGATKYCDSDGANCFTAANLCAKVPNLCN